MRNFIVGDIQGCLSSLHCLLETVNFDPARDHLWSVGDLVNRGPDSLGALRYLMSLGDHFHTVLGNHDLHLLALAYGITSPKKGDTLDAVLSASDSAALIDWLRHQPLLLEGPGWLIVHAGIPHMWSLTEARFHADEVHQALSGKDPTPFLQAMYGNEPDTWSGNLMGVERLRVITNYLTRMRICTQLGQLNLSFKKSLSEIPETYRAWFHWHSDDTLERKSVFFGHWAALEGGQYGNRFHALDTGCVWGEKLTLWEIETGQSTSCTCS